MTTNSVIRFRALLFIRSEKEVGKFALVDENHPFVMVHITSQEFADTATATKDRTGKYFWGGSKYHTLHLCSDIQHADLLVSGDPCAIPPLDPNDESALTLFCGIFPHEADPLKDALFIASAACELQRAYLM
jgi:hypothetical protein